MEKTSNEFDRKSLFVACFHTRPVGSKSPSRVIFRSESMTDQQFLRMSEITSILARHKATGLMPQRVDSIIPFGMQTAPELDDFQAVLEFSDSLKTELSNFKGHTSSTAGASAPGVTNGTPQPEGLTPVDQSSKADPVSSDDARA